MTNRKNFDEQGTPIVSSNFVNEFGYFLNVVDLNGVSKMLRKIVLGYMRHEFQVGGDFELIIVTHFGELEFLFDFFDFLEEQYQMEE